MPRLVFLGRKRVSITETQRRNSAGRVLRRSAGCLRLRRGPRRTSSAGLPTPPAWRRGRRPRRHRRDPRCRNWAHEITDAASARQLRRIVRQLRWRGAGGVSRPPDGVAVSARPRGRPQRHRRRMAERDGRREPGEGAPGADLVHGVVDQVLLADRRVALGVDRPEELAAHHGTTTQRRGDTPETAVRFPLGQRRHHTNGQQIAGEVVIHQGGGQGRSFQPQTLGMHMHGAGDCLRNLFKSPPPSPGCTQ